VLVDLGVEIEGLLIGRVVFKPQLLVLVFDLLAVADKIILDVGLPAVVTRHLPARRAYQRLESELLSLLQLL
jgi:hypothetical protein